MPSKSTHQDKMIRHDMPFAHFWQDVGNTFSKQNRIIGNYMSQRLDDSGETAMTLAKTRDPVSAMSVMTSYWLRSGSETAAMMAGLAMLPLEIGEEVADLVDAEAKIMEDAGEAAKKEVFENSPV